MGPYIRSKDTTSKIIIRLIISLIPFIIYTIYKNGFNILLNIIISSFAILLIESIFLKNKDKLFSILKGVILSLILPMDVPKFILITASFIISITNITLENIKKIRINPIMVGYLIIILIFGSSLIKLNGSVSGIDANYLSFVNGNLSINFNIISILCLLSFIYLVLTKTLKWKISISYIITIFVINFVIGELLNQNIYFSLYHILNGGIIFSAIYLVNDFKTTTITSIGQISQGILTGIFTVLLRYLGMEYIATSIIISNLLIIFLDSVGVKSKLNLSILLKWFILIWILIIMEILGLAIMNKNNPKINNINIQKSLT